MGRALAHRGPDDEGEMIRNTGAMSVGLGHKRLSIIDLSTAGKQPMANEDETVWVSLNGEIYNYQELRKELEDKGHVPLAFHRDPELKPFQPYVDGNLPTPSGKVEFYSEALAAQGLEGRCQPVGKRVEHGAVRSSLH